MTIFIFLAMLMLAAILVPFQVIGLLVGLLAVQAVLIQQSAKFVMGGVPFSKAFTAAIWSSVFTVIAAVAVFPALLSGISVLMGAIILFSAIWLASVLAYSLALEATFAASATIAIVTSIVGYLATKAIDLGVAVGSSVAG